MKEIFLLDCTLRDGGFINDWCFGQDNIVNIFERLVDAEVDFIEVGFLDERRSFDKDRTIMPNSQAVNQLFGDLDKGTSKTVAMIDYGTCSIDKILPRSESWLDGIRVIFQKRDRIAAISFCQQIKDLGYMVFVQAVSITSYSVEEMEELLLLVNSIEPYAFSVVDTYGLLHKQELSSYYHCADNKLISSIGIGYHAHNNFQLAYANCIELIENPPKNRSLILDGSLYGMGKSAGNAPLELLAMYMNEHHDTNYQISQFLEAIDSTIMDIYQTSSWGYSLKFYIAAANDCHPSYVSYLINKKKLSVKGINTILALLENNKRLSFDAAYIEDLYLSYQKKYCDDTQSISLLNLSLENKEILMVGPGNSVVTNRNEIKTYIKTNNPIVISVNFIPEFPIDYVFISNAKRYTQLSSCIRRMKNDLKVIATSNVTKTSGYFDYAVEYSALLDEEALIIDNPQIILLKLLYRSGVRNVILAGFDGYQKAEQPNYANPNMEHSFSKRLAEEINKDVIESMNRLPNELKTLYLTPTKYEINT